jgi:hypothetical protein
LHFISHQKKRIMAKYGKKSQEKVEDAMHDFKRGELKSGPEGKGGTVQSREQAIAIGLSEARDEGAKVPDQDSSSMGNSGNNDSSGGGSSKSSGGRKRSSGRKSAAKKSSGGSAKKAPAKK